MSQKHCNGDFLVTNPLLSVTNKMCSQKRGLPRQPLFSVYTGGLLSFGGGSLAYFLTNPFFNEFTELLCDAYFQPFETSQWCSQSIGLPR